MLEPNLAAPAQEVAGCCPDAEVLPAEEVGDKLVERRGEALVKLDCVLVSFVGSEGDEFCSSYRIWCARQE